MKCRNDHTAKIDAVEPGKVGEFDPKNPAVKLWIEHKLLVETETESKPRRVPKPGKSRNR